MDSQSLSDMESRILNYHHVRLNPIGYNNLRVKSNSLSSEGNCNQNSPEYPHISVSGKQHPGNTTDWYVRHQSNASQYCLDTSSENDSFDAEDDLEKSKVNKVHSFDTEDNIEETEVNKSLSFNMEERKNIEVYNVNDEDEVDEVIETHHTDTMENMYLNSSYSIGDQSLVEGRDYEVILVYTVNPNLPLLDTSSEDDEEEYVNDKDSSRNDDNCTSYTCQDREDINLEPPLISNVDEYFVKNDNRNQHILNVEKPVVKNVDEYFLDPGTNVVPNIDDFFIKIKQPEEETKQFSSNKVEHLIVTDTDKTQENVKVRPEPLETETNDVDISINESDLAALPHIDDLQKYFIDDMMCTKFRHNQISCSVPQLPMQNICIDVDDARTCLSFENPNQDLSDLTFENEISGNPSYNNKTNDVPRTLTDDDINSFFCKYNNTEIGINKQDEDDLCPQDMEIDTTISSVPTIIDPPTIRMTTTPIPTVLNHCTKKTSKEAATAVKESSSTLLQMPTPINSIIRRSQCPEHSDFDNRSPKKQYSVPDLKRGQSSFKFEVLSSNKILNSRHRSCKSKKVVYHISSDEETEKKNCKNKIVSKSDDRDFKNKASAKLRVKHKQSNCNKKLSPPHSDSAKSKNKTNHSVVLKNGCKPSDNFSQNSNSSIKLTIKNKSEVILNCDYTDSQKDKTIEVDCKNSDNMNTNNLEKKDKNINELGKNEGRVLKTCSAVEEEQHSKNKNFCLPPIPKPNMETTITKEEPIFKKRKISLMEYKLRRGVSSNTTSAQVSSKVISPDIPSPRLDKAVNSPLVQTTPNESLKTADTVNNETKFLDPIKEAARNFLVNSKKRKAEAIRKRDEAIVMSKMNKVENFQLQPLISDAEMVKIVGITKPEEMKLPIAKEKPRVSANYEEIILVSVGTNTNKDMFQKPAIVYGKTKTTSPLADSKFIDNKMSSNSLFSRIQDVVMKKSPKDIAETYNERHLKSKSNLIEKCVKTTIIRDHDSKAEHGEDKVILHLHKHRSKPKTSNALVQTDQIPDFTTLAAHSLLQQSPLMRKRNDSDMSISSDGSKKEIEPLVKRSREMVIQPDELRPDRIERETKEERSLYKERYNSKYRYRSISTSRSRKKQSRSRSQSRSHDCYHRDRQSDSSYKRKRRSRSRSYNKGRSPSARRDQPKIIKSGPRTSPRPARPEAGFKTPVKKYKSNSVSNSEIVIRPKELRPDRPERETKEKQSLSKERFNSKYRCRSRSTSRSCRKRSRSRNQSRSHGFHPKYRRSDSPYKRKCRSRSRSYNKGRSPSARPDRPEIVKSGSRTPLRPANPEARFKTPAKIFKPNALSNSSSSSSSSFSLSSPSSSSLPSSSSSSDSSKLRRSYGSFKQANNPFGNSTQLCY